MKQIKLQNTIVKLLTLETVREMSITSIITCINMTHTICIVDEKQRSSKMEPVCESYGAYDMVSLICICNAMIILILCSQTDVGSY